MKSVSDLGSLIYQNIPNSHKNGTSIDKKFKNRSGYRKQNQRKNKKNYKEKQFGLNPLDFPKI